MKTQTLDKKTLNKQHKEFRKNRKTPVKKRWEGVVMGEMQS